MAHLNGTAALIAAAAAVAATAPASAHHSFAMFDFAKTTTIEGSVTEFQWTNPHTELVVMGAPAGQPAKVWTFELTSPSNLLRMGWDKRALKPGDKVKIEANPLRSGEAGGALRKATLIESGKVYTATRLTDVQRRGD